MCPENGHLFSQNELGRWVPLLLFAGIVWVVVKIAPFAWLLAKALLWLVPLWLFSPFSAV